MVLLIIVVFALLMLIWLGCEISISTGIPMFVVFLAEGLLLTPLIIMFFKWIDKIPTVEKGLAFNKELQSATLLKRTYTNSWDLKIQQYTLTTTQYNPSKTIYTGATVGGVTTGGFHKTDAYYSTKSLGGSGGYYIYVNKGDDGFILNSIVLPDDLIKDAQLDSRVSHLLSGNKILLKHNNEKTKLNSSEQYVLKNAIDSFNVPLQEHITQRAFVASLLSKQECKNVIEWICENKVEQEMRRRENEAKQAARKKKARKILLTFSVVLLSIAIVINTVSFIIYQPLRNAFKNNVFDVEFVEDTYGTLQNKKNALKIVEKELEKCHKEGNIKDALHILTVLAKTNCEFTYMYYDSDGNNGQEYRAYIMGWRSFVKWIEDECKQNGTQIETEGQKWWDSKNTLATYSIFDYKVTIKHSIYGDTTAARIFVDGIGWYDIDCSDKNLGNWFYHFGNSMVD